MDINVVQDSAGKATKLLHYMPVQVMCISPLVGLDLYSDNSTQCDGSGYPSEGSTISSAPSTINSVAGIGNPSTEMCSKYLLSGGKPYVEFFEQANDRIISASGFKYFAFGNFFRRYKRFKNLIYYHFLKDATKITNGGQVFTTANCGIVREISSTSCIWLLPSGASSLLYLRIGTIATDGTITWGAPQLVTTSAATLNPANYDVCQIATDKVAMIYYSSTVNIAYVTIATISGTVATIGTPVQINTAASPLTLGCKIVKDGTDKFVAAYCLTTKNAYLRCATVSGTTPTLGTEVGFGTGAAVEYIHGLALNGTDAFTVTWVENSNITLKAESCTISGTTITEGSEVTIVTGTSLTNGGLAARDSLKKIDTDKFLCIVLDTNGIFNATVITVSGTVTTGNTVYTFALSANNEPNYMHEVTAGSVYISYLGITGQESNATKMTISGTVITFTYKLKPLLFYSEQYCINRDGLELQSSTPYNGATVMEAGVLGMGLVGSYVVALSFVSTTIFNYMVAHIDNDFEVYNDGTIIGSALTPNEPFVQINQSIDSVLGGSKAYMKVKNTNASPRTMLIEAVICEVD